MNSIYFLSQQIMSFFIPLLVVALGGMFSERSGIVNIALEGIMILGAFAGVIFMNQVVGTMPSQLLLMLTLLVSGLAGMVFSLLHAYASININADQIIGGTALNMFAPAFAIFVARTLTGVQQVHFKNTFKIASVPFLGNIPVIGNLFFKNIYITTYIGVGIYIIANFLIYKTKFGLRLRACGEHPHAADSVGVNVYRMRYAGVLISGFLAGVGGLIFIIPTSTNFNASVSGYGYLALAVLIFGQWEPNKIFGAALFFGIIKTIAAAYSGIPFLNSLGIPNAIYKMIPYIITLVALAFTSKNSRAPRASGKPYDVGSR